MIASVIIVVVPFDNIYFSVALAFLIGSFVLVGLLRSLFHEPNINELNKSIRLSRTVL